MPLQTRSAVHFAQWLKQRYPKYSSTPDDALILAFIKTNPRYKPNFEGETLVSVSWEAASAASSQAPVTKKCLACTSVISMTTKFCPECGASQTAANCISCKAEIPESAKFCAECGTSQTPETTPSLTLKSCLCCGAKNPDEYSYCSKCGRPFSASASDAETAPSSIPTEPAESTRAAHENISEQKAEKPRLASQQETQTSLQPDVAASLRPEVPASQTSPPDKMTPQQKLYFQQEYDKQVRNPSTALILTLLLGGFGAHRFYLRQWGWGAAYIIFAWTFIPILVALVECFLIRKRTEEYNKHCAQEILTKMNVIFSEPEIAVAMRMY